MKFLKQDVFYAARQLRKSPGFTIAVLLTLGVGIGANLTVFLILYGVLLRPLPFPHPQELVRINRFYRDGTVVPAYSGTKALFLRRASNTLESAAIYSYLPNRVNLIQSNEVVPLEALQVTSDFFHVFQMEPRIGRGFRPEDMTPNVPGVAVLSDAAWRLYFAADPNILGRSIILGNQTKTVIGIANPHFGLDTRVDIWTALQIVESPEDKTNNYNFVGRLKGGVTRNAAQEDLKRALLQMSNTYPDLWNRNESVRIVDLHDSLVGQMRPALEVLTGAVALVLATVCANIISLLLTRSVARRREMALRVALGASGWRILRQLLVENVLVCFLGGILGALLADFATPILLHLSPIAVPHFAKLQISGTTLLYATALVLGCTLLFSLVPAVESGRTQLTQSLRVNSTQIAGGRSLPQSLLIVAEVAMSVILLVGAGLMLTSFRNLKSISPGFDVKNLLTFKTSFTSEQTATSAVLSRRLDELVMRLEAQPGVGTAAALNSLPTQPLPNAPFEILGRPTDRLDASGVENYIPVTNDYFKALHIPVLAGRSFGLSDAPGAEPVAIVNEQIVRTHFKRENPIGQHIRVGAAMGLDDGIRQIVGVVGDTRNSGLNAPSPGIIYFPFGQIPDSMTQGGVGERGVSWIVRTKGAQRDVAAAARRIFMDNARTPLLSVEPMENVISASVAQQRFTMLLLSCFGFISLLLGAAGLYGLMSYTVAHRTKEIGVRMAIGADRTNILSMVLREAGLLVGLGLVLGIIASLAGAQLLRRLLFDVTPHDPFTLAATCGVLLLTGVLAAWWPASRAASTDPMRALRAE